MTAKKVSEKFVFENGITAEISPESISLLTYQGQRQFLFTSSKAETIESVAKTMLEAVAICKKMNKDEFKK